MRTKFALFAKGVATIKMKGRLRFINDDGEVVGELDLSKEKKQKVKISCREVAGYDEYYLVFEARVYPPTP